MSGFDSSLSSLVDKGLQAKWDSGISKSEILETLFETQVDNGVMPRAQIQAIRATELFERSGEIGRAHV